MKKCLLSACFLLVFSCSKDDSEGTSPELPINQSYDLNDDGLDDIGFVYVQDDVITDGEPGYVGYVEPLNGGFLLISQGRGWVFDLRLNDKIEKEEHIGSTWYPSNLAFISIDDSPKGIWPVNWSLSSKKETGPYYSGIKVKEGDRFLVGWIKMEIDKKTAEVKFLDYKLTSADFIDIGN